ncbi:DUF4625 domain-containing protein [Marinoscillum furvescens]|uniref:Uncharacterized protein DUF4625 n=1 Tax=Marinoscillum furvescens DSM 4134 TaxID=1122208 RepID=A0A3D9KW88_MARFU|nr:DUF4625 domain-containing protein [Marinoscillum furvescens]RED92236.1 uncharacterized protein DUF4625 [Marinoscillum furvescens DSM 4134]
MRRLTLSLGLVTAMFVMACEDDTEVDITAPTITLEEPVMGESFAAGEELHFDAMFEDDVELATFNLSIHDNFNGHSHGRVAVTPFDFDQSYTLSGKTQDVHEHIDIPVDATAGPYHLVVDAIDAAGNATNFADGSSKEVEIWITNEEMAHVHFEDANGTEVEEYEGVVGEELKFYGEIEDEVGTLDHIEIVVGHLEDAEEHDHDHSHGRVLEENIYDKDVEAEGETSVLLQDLLEGESIVVTQSDLDELEEGEHLYLIVKVTDSDGNIARHSIEIHFD